MHDSTIPADLLDLKARLEQWRATRKYKREPIPGHFRQAASEMARLYSPSLVRRVLKLDPWRLKKSAAQKPTPTRRNSVTAFFQLPPEAALPALGSSASPQPAATCRLQLERPDGSRLTFRMPAFDTSTITALCSHFLRA